MVGGSITADQTVLNFKGKRRDSLVGTPAASPMADSIDSAGMEEVRNADQHELQGWSPSPSLFATVYYFNMKAALDALEAVKGDLSGNQEKYREALKNADAADAGR